MADNTKPSEDASVATKEQGGHHHQKVFAEFSVGGTPTLVSSSDPLPVGDATATGLLEAIGALLTTIDGDTSNLAAILARLTEIEEDSDNLAAIKAAVEVIDNAIAGSEMQVDIVGALPAGANAIGKLAANSGVDIGDVDVTSLTGGTVAHDAADSGNPIKMGARAVTALIAAVANNDRADLTTDKFARLLATVAPLDQRVSSTLNRTNAEAGQLLAAAASTAYVVTAITVVNAHASVGTKVEILDGASAKWKGYAGPLGGGFAITDPSGLFVGTANTKLEGKCATTGADVDINVSAYKVPA